MIFFEVSSYLVSRVASGGGGGGGGGGGAGPPNLFFLNFHPTGVPGSTPFPPPPPAGTGKKIKTLGSTLGSTN